MTRDAIATTAARGAESFYADLHADPGALRVCRARLSGDGLQWPCPSRDHPGTANVHADGFLRGRGLLVAVDYAASPEHGVPEHPYLLVTGRVLHHYNVGTMTRRTPQRELEPARPRPAPDCRCEAPDLNKVKSGRLLRRGASAHPPEDP